MSQAPNYLQLAITKQNTYSLSNLAVVATGMSPKLIKTRLDKAGIRPVFLKVMSDGSTRPYYGEDAANYARVLSLRTKDPKKQKLFRQNVIEPMQEAKAAITESQATPAPVEPVAPVELPPPAVEPAPTFTPQPDSVLARMAKVEDVLAQVANVLAAMTSSARMADAKLDKILSFTSELAHELGVVATDGK